MSTRQERLDQIFFAYRDAYARRRRDLGEATAEQVDAVISNVDQLELLWLRAARQSLEASGQQVEDAYQAAKNANEETRRAYEQARDLAERITQVGKLVGAIGNLLEKAAAL